MGSIINRSKRRDKPALYVKYQEHGRQRMVHSHQPTKELARKFLAQIEANIAAGKVGMAEPTPEDLAKKRMTVRELGKRFVTEYASPRVKDVDRYRKMAEYLFGKHLYPAVGAVPAMALTAAQLERFRDERRAAGLGPQSVRHVLAFASRMYNWAAAKGIIDCSNPSEAVDKPQLGRDDDDFDYLSRDEVESLLNWAKEHQPSECPLYSTAVYTGMRLGELYGLRWSDVTFDLGIIGVRRSYRTTPKSGKGRHVRINRWLVPILRAWKAQCPATAEGLVFPAPPPEEHGKLSAEQAAELRQRAAGGERRSVLARAYGVSWTAVAKIVRGERKLRAAEPGMRSKDGDYGFQAALASAGCHRVRFHDLRHTFASHFMMAGGSILALQKILGHSSVKVTEKYAHLSPDFMAQESGRVSFESAPAGVVPLRQTGTHTSTRGGE